MRIGILTFHNACNHGAVLQCYALQTVLTRMGHDVQVIDYHQPYVENMYKPICLENIPRKPRETYRYLKHSPQRWLRRRKFKSFLSNHLKLSQQCSDISSIPFDLDAYIIGSDQVWSVNCTQNLDPVYFGFFERNKDAGLIGYGISLPNNLLKQIDKDWLKKSVYKFNAISFREQKNTEYISEIFPESNPVTVLDPSLLLEKEDYESLIEYDSPKAVCTFIFDYRLTKRQRKDIVRQTKYYADIKQLPHIDLHKYIISPEELISYIKNAEIVITDSFHVSVLSLILRKRLQSIICSDEHDLRYGSLLKSIGAEQALCIPESINFNVSIEYKAIGHNLSKLKIDSLNFLKNSLSCCGIPAAVSRTHAPSSCCGIPAAASRSHAPSGTN